MGAFSSTLVKLPAEIDIENAKHLMTKHLQPSKIHRLGFRGEATPEAGSVRSAMLGIGEP